MSSDPFCDRICEKYFSCLAVTTHGFYTVKRNLWSFLHRILVKIALENIVIIEYYKVNDINNSYLAVRNVSFNCEIAADWPCRK